MPLRKSHDDTRPQAHGTERGDTPLFARGMPSQSPAPGMPRTFAEALHPRQTASAVATVTPSRPAKDSVKAKPAQATPPVLADTPRAWPRGRWHETGAVLGDFFVALARLLSWLIAGIGQILFAILRGVARGLGYIAGKLSGDRIRARGAEVTGWLLLGLVVAVTVSSLGTIRGFIVDRYFTHHYKRVVVPYVPPPSACVLPRAACAAPTETLDGQPSISASGILQVLTQYNSPAASPDFAAQLYDMGITNGVNPAYALAFFVEESQCGTQGIAVNTQSLGNIRYTDSNSPAPYGNYNGFRKYSSWSDGAKDWYWIIRTYYLNQGIRDVYDVTQIYAPGTDNNDPQRYAQTVYQLVQSWAGK